MKAPLSIATWLWALVLLPTVPLTAVLGYTAYQYALEREHQLTLSLIDQTEELARRAEVQIERVSGALTTLSLAQAVERHDMAALHAFARRVQQASPTLSAISLVDRDDQLVFLTLSPLGSRLPAAQLDSVHEAFRTGRPNLSRPFKSPVSNNTVVALNVPVLRHGEVLYCLRGIFSVSTLADLIRPEGLPADWLAGIFDQEGTTVARSRSPALYVGQPAAPAMLEAIAHRTRAAWSGKTKEGIDTLSVVRQIGDWGWFVALAVPDRTLTAPLEHELFRFTALTLGTLALLSLTLLVLCRHIARRLDSVADDARQAISGRVPLAASTGILELDELRRSLSHADLYRQAILDQVQQRTAELRAAQQRLTEFARQQEDNIEHERLRIAREVHDQIGAIFSGVAMLLGGLPPSALSSEQRRTLDAALQQGVTTARRITAELRPPLLDDLGLQTALEELARNVLTPAQIDSQVDLAAAQCLTARQTIACYRIVQEALTNVLRHSRAAACQITGRAEPPGAYTLTITDNGQSPPAPDDHGRHFGLTSMRERALLLGGELQIEHPTGQGFLVRVILPLDTERSQDV